MDPSNDTRLRILALLDVPADAPKADKVAKARLARMGIGETCTRCYGSGSYSFNTTDGSRCYGCGGIGVVGTALDSASLQALEDAKDSGQLSRFRLMWWAQGVERCAHTELMRLWRGTGIERQYSWFKSADQKPGEWHHDIAVINQRMCDAYQSLPAAPSSATLRAMTTEERLAWYENYAAAYEHAKQVIKDAEHELADYLAGHTRPD